MGIFHFKGVGEYQGVFAEGKPFGEGQFAFTEGGEDVQVLIKGMWNGFELPEDVEIKFANGDIYKGKIVNGTLSPTGNGRAKKTEYSRRFPKVRLCLTENTMKPLKKYYLGSLFLY